MANLTDPHLDFRFLSSQTHQKLPNFASSSCSPGSSYHQNQNPRKKRSKLIKLDPNPCSSKPKPAKKPDPSAPKITRPCSECGKKFWSWKALFGHMRCHPERQWRGINPPPNFHSRPISPIKQRSNVEAPIMTEDDHEVASCLLMLANGVSFADKIACDTSYQSGVVEETGGYRFECSSCKKVFGSHQALGGHRASHKNVKGCFAITRSDGFEAEEHHGGSDVGDHGALKESLEDGNKMVMVLGHRCSICLRVFSSGQALGGHKRCHWEKSEEPPLNQRYNSDDAKEGFGLDLNLPAPVEDDASSSYSSELTLDIRLGL